MIQCNTKVAVLLAAYCGENYLPTQINSILAQTCSDWTLYLSDDGSNDRTKAILQEYADRYPEKIVYLQKDFACGNACDHFFYLTEQIDAPYLMYCDQDDKWMPEKITLTLQKMQSIEQDSLPCLIYTDLAVTDEALKPLSPSFFSFSSLDGERNQLHQLVVQNVVTGCTMMINRTLRELALLAKNNQSVLMHDWWFALIASSMGKIALLPRATIFYRQHGNNSVGAKNTKSGSYLLQKLHSAQKDRASLIDTMKQAIVFQQIYGKLLKKEAFDLLSTYGNAAERNKFVRLSVVLKYHIWKKGLLRKIAQILYL